MTPEEIQADNDLFTAICRPADVGRVWQGWAVKGGGRGLRYPGHKFYASAHKGDSEIVAVRITAALDGPHFGWLRAGQDSKPTMVYGSAFFVTMCLNVEPVDYAKRHPGERGVRLHLEEIPADGVGDALVEIGGRTTEVTDGKR